MMMDALAGFGHGNASEDEVQNDDNKRVDLEHTFAFGCKAVNTSWEWEKCRRGE